MRVLQIPVLQTNYVYVVICEKTNQAFVIDSPDAPATRNALKKENVEFVAIVDTHHHWDHVGGNEDLLKSHPHITIYGSAFDKGRVPGLSQTLVEGDTFNMGSLSFKILDIPGHTLGHIALYGHGALFCGDTLFLGGCGRLFEGTAEEE